MKAMLQNIMIAIAVGLYIAICISGLGMLIYLSVNGR